MFSNVTGIGLNSQQVNFSYGSGQDVNNEEQERPIHRRHHHRRENEDGGKSLEALTKALLEELEKKDSKKADVEPDKKQSAASKNPAPQKSSQKLIGNVNGNNIYINGDGNIVTINNKTGDKKVVNDANTDKKANTNKFGSPDIAGANGDKFGFNNAGTFNLLADKGLNINGKMEADKNNVNSLTEVGMLIGADSVEIDKTGKLSVNGKNVQLEEGAAQTLADGTTITRKGNSYVTSGQEYNTTATYGNGHINMDVTSKDQGVTADGVAPTGVLGETFMGNQKSGLDSDLSAYSRNNLFDTQTKQTQPGTQPVAQNVAPQQQLAYGYQPTGGAAQAQSPANLNQIINIVMMFFNNNNNGIQM